MTRARAGALASLLVFTLLAISRPAPPRSGAPAWPPLPARFARTFDLQGFLKGNLHAHSSLSDGDSPPEEVIRWYRDRGYGFLALTDHNLLADPASYASLQDDTFRLIPGEEITMMGAGRQVHVNAFCLQRPIPGGPFPSVQDALLHAVGAVTEQGGVSLINHPNFDRALVLDDVLAAGSAHLLEVQSGHPYVYPAGLSDRPSHEALWDAVLSGGASLMGVAVDDTHRLQACGDPPAYPGQGWVQVAAPSLRVGDLCAALGRGSLYASTGAEIRRVKVTEGDYTVWPVDEDAEVSFVGQGGRLLQTGRFPEAVHVISGAEGYVRARVVSARGTAWLPAVRVVPGQEGCRQAGGTSL